MKKIEILAPAGSFETLNAAINAGCDAIYFGVGQLNMRAARAANFQIHDLDEISHICHSQKIKCYLALNTVVYDHELDQIRLILKSARDAQVDAVIASDLAVIKIARDLGLSVHISTQASISNLESLKFYAQFADRVVLARELSLLQISQLISQIKKQKIIGPSKKLVEVEVFVHGAMCVAVSGRCGMSLYNHNLSANRGECIQVCRRPFKVTETGTNQELIIDNNFVMSASDLCTIPILEQIVNSGVASLKIEGRARAADYVDTVVKSYKQAIKYIQEKSYTTDKIKEIEQNLSSVFNRGFSTGFYLGLKSDSWANSSDNKSTVSKTRVGKILKYYPKINVAEVQIIDKIEIQSGDNFIITGSTTGIVRGQFQDIPQSHQGQIITFKVNSKVRPNDTLFLIKDSIC